MCPSDHVRELDAMRLARRLERERRARQEAERVADQVIARLANARDELERRTRRLEAALREAERTRELRTNLLNTVAHLLQTPLTILLMNLAVAERTTGAAGHQPLERARHAANRLSTTIADLIRIAQIEAGLVVMRPALAPLLELVDQATADLPHPVEVTKPPGEPRWQVLVDSEKLVLALQMALREAFNASSDHSVAMTLRRYAQGVELAITHSGPPAGALQAGNAMGSVGELEGVDVQGLHWQICEGLVRAMAGSADYEPDHPAGPSLVIRLPLIEAASADMPGP